MKIEVPMLDVAVFSMNYIQLGYLMTGEKPRRQGNAHHSVAGEGATCLRRFERRCACA